MLKSYQVDNIYDRKNAMKEIMQEIVLCGLSHAGFFKEAAFYGGTALRIFYGLDRFSEDLDFSLEQIIRSAFLKGNTKEHLLLFYADERVVGSVAKNEVVKIKFEVDTNPPAFATYEHKYRLLPVPYEIRLYDMPSLFAGKIHAVICRGWQSRFDSIDFLQARKDVEPFRNTSVLDIWSSEFFKQIMEGLKVL